MGVMAIQYEGMRTSIEQEERLHETTLKLECKEAKHRAGLETTETRMRWALEREATVTQPKKADERHLMA